MKKVKLNIVKDALQAMKLNAKEKKYAERELLKGLKKNDPKAWKMLEESQRKINIK